MDKLLDVSDSGRQLCGTEVSEIQRVIWSSGFCQEYSRCRIDSEAEVQFPPTFLRTSAVCLRLRLLVKTSLRICPEESERCSWVIETY